MVTSKEAVFFALQDGKLIFEAHSLPIQSRYLSFASRKLSFTVSEVGSFAGEHIVEISNGVSLNFFVVLATADFGS